MQTTFSGPSPRPAPVSIRTAGLDDLDAIDAVEAQSFVYDRFPRRNLARMLASPSAVFILAEVERGVAGYAAVLFRTGTKVARLYSIAVAPDHRGHDVAGQLLAQAEALAVRWGRDRMRLEFRSSNDRAHRLYLRAGYVALATKPDYYGDGETAIRMEKRLEPASASD